MIDFRQLTYRYPGPGRPVVQDLTLNIEEGEFVLVMGPSGAGKSTLLRCLNGLVPHFYGGALSGSVAVADRDPVALGPQGMADAVGFVLQDPEAQFVVDKVEDELAFALENQGLDPMLMRKRIEEVLDQLGIAHLRNRSVNTLSGGERQRIAIAAVMTLQPRVLVLDEPTSQLDPQAAEEVLDTLVKLNQDLGLTIMLSEHRLERVVQYVDRILYLSGNGRPPLLDEPRAVLQQIDLAPPLVALAKSLHWSPLPLTIKEGRRFARGHRLPATEDDPWEGASIASAAPSTPAITVQDLRFSYNGHPAIRDVTLQVNQGEFVALMGRNGSGKTTLLKQLVGLLKPDRGSVEVRQPSSQRAMDTRNQGIEELIRVIGYVPQNPSALLFSDTVSQELDFTRRGHDLPPGDYSGLLDTLGLSSLADRYPRDLSVGERQRVALASILVAEPQILLLDEPTRGLDYQQKAALAAFLKSQKKAGRTIIMATHDVELVANCADRVILLSRGQVAVDGPARSFMTESLVFASQINKLFRHPALLTVEDVLEMT
jgi:energy-coupling factor transport system ATP-binding protein